MSPSGERTERAATGGSFPGAILTALLGLLLAIAIVVVPKLRRDRALPALAGAAAEPDRPRAETASPLPAPGSGTGGTSGTQSAAILRALRRRTVTRMDPAIGPMAADAFDRLAGEAERGPDPGASQEDPPERRGADGEGT